MPTAFDHWNEAPTHPHIRARGTFVEDAGVLRPAAAPRFERAAPMVSPSPAIGEHTLRVLRSQGLSESEIDRLRADRVIAVAE